MKLTLTDEQVNHILYAVRTNSDGTDDETLREARGVIETIEQQLREDN